VAVAAVVVVVARSWSLEAAPATEASEVRAAILARRLAMAGSAVLRTETAGLAVAAAAREDRTLAGVPPVQARTAETARAVVY
jgi:hypothetical protein